MSLTICKLSSMGLLQVAGPDAEKFLQGQLTCDVSEASPSTLINGAHCNNKGRMIANFQITRPDHNTFILYLKKSAISILQASLNKYIVFSKAETQDLTDSHDLFGLIGDVSTTDFNEALDSASKFELSAQRSLFWTPAESLTVKNRFEAAVNTEDDSAWQTADILDGQGWIDGSTSEEYLPQMLNLDIAPISGINFTKGCYTGQEIVARMHYKGQTKKRLIALRANHQTNVDILTDIYSDLKDKSVGSVINLACDDTACHMLAVVAVEAITSGTLFLDTEKRRQLQQTELPYAITT